jgi:hypothetical protein
MSYEINEGRLGCLIEIYANFLEENSNYIIDRNNNLEYFKSILEKIKKKELTDDDLKEIFSKKRLYSVPPFFKPPMRNKLLTNVIEQVEFFNKENQRLDENKINEISRSLEDNKSYFALTTELLCVFYPDQYCIKNNKVEDMIKKLNELGVLLVKEKNFYEDYDKLIEFEGVILKYMQNNRKLRNVYPKIIDRINMNYYDVDAFLYWIIDDNYKEENNLEILTKKIEQCLDKESVKERSMKTLVNYLQYKGFYFDQGLITAFYSALKTKGFVILSGLTGTGKTKLAQLFAELLCPNCNPQDEQNTQIAQTSSEKPTQCNCTHLFLPVRPDWRDSKALLGYHNPITGNYESTKLLQFIVEAIDNYNTYKNNAIPHFIILDEMNLSHVEYYFAEFLSVLESGRDENYWTKETIKLHNSEKPLLDNNGKEIPKEIKLPPNLYIIGSVNVDETTYIFSPKVLDRAFTIEFREVNFDDYSQFEIDKEKAKSIIETIRKGLLEDLRNKKNDQARFSGAVADKEEIKEALNWIKESKVRSEKSIFDELKELNQILHPYDLHFGYRVLDEIALFIKYATNAPNEVGKLDKKQALDFAVLMKVLPKFHGPRQKLERPLWLVLNWCLVNSAKFDNKTFDDLIIGIWEELSYQKKRPSIEDFTHVIQKLIQELKLKLNNRSENVSQEAMPESQTIDENQSQTEEETKELTSEAHQNEQTSKDEKATIIDNVKYPRTAIKVLRMLRQLYETGFTSFA